LRRPTTDLRGLPLRVADRPALLLADHRPTLRLPSGAPACCPDRLTPASSPGVGPTPGLHRTPGPSPLRQLCTFFRRTVRASTPGHGRAHHLRPPETIRKSCSDHVVSHHLAGFLRAAARRLVASCSRPWGSPRFTRTSRSWPRSSRRDHPSKDAPNRSSCSGHPEPWPPWRSPSNEPRWSVIADATRATRDEAGTFEALSARMVCNVRAPCGAENALSFLGFCLLFEVPPTAWPLPPPRHRESASDAPTIVTERTRRFARSIGEVPPPTVQNRRTGL